MMIDLADLRDHGLNYSDDQLAAMTAWFSALIAERDSLALKLDQRRWIPVTERMPPMQRMVLLYATPTEQNWGIGYGWHDFGTRLFLHRMATAEPVEFENCTHWMPLPEPPK